MLGAQVIGQQMPAAQLAFVGNSAGVTALYRHDVARNISVHLSGLTGIFAPVWSPDGQQIAFFAEVNDQQSDIFVADAAGRDLRRLTDSPAEDLFPTWSTDGESLLFTSHRNGNADIFTVAVAGGDPRPLISDSANDTSAVMSPDGRYIAFVSYRDRRPDPEIWVKHVVDGHEQRLTSNRDADLYPAWSPDSRYILYVSDRDIQPDIWHLDVEALLEAAQGTNLLSELANADAYRRVTDQRRVVNRLDWSPDGSTIVYAVPGRGGSIYLVDADGSDPRQLCTRLQGRTLACTGLSFPTWRPSD